VPEEKLVILDRQINYFEKYYKGLALSTSTLKLFNREKQGLWKHRLNSENGDFMKALNLIFKAEENISQASKRWLILSLLNFIRIILCGKKMCNMPRIFPKKDKPCFWWIKWMPTLIVLKGGKEFKILTVEFGDNWMGDKSMAGDKATPEGIYKVQAKKEWFQNQILQALLLDYPNKEDQGTV
jgi:hypothetical protein